MTSVREKKFSFVCIWLSFLIDLNLEINILSQDEQDRIGTGYMITPRATLNDDHKKEKEKEKEKWFWVWNEKLFLLNNGILY